MPSSPKLPLLNRILESKNGRRRRDVRYGDLAPWTTKYRYEPVFGVPDEPWKIGAIWEEAYFDSAKYVIEGVLNRDLMPRVDGVAGIFLFRHYIEIALKFIIFHARWLVEATAWR
jgi:hypothetical protein